MTKKCYSVKVDSFGKHLKKDFNSKQIEKIYEKIKELEAAENQYMESSHGDRTKLNHFGKTLSKIGHKDIYCLEVGTDRFLAKVIENDQSKVFAWYWAGSHEKYNNVLKQIAQNKKGHDSIDEEVATQIKTIDAEKTKEESLKKISEMRGGNSLNKHHSYRG